MDEKHDIHRLEPIVHERKVISNRNILFAVFIGVIVIFVQFSFVFFFELGLRDSLIIGFVLILFYGIFLIFLIEPRVIREIHNLEVKTIQKQTPQQTLSVRQEIKPTPISEPLIPKEVIRTIERPVERIVEKRVPIYIQTPRKKLNIPKYDYLGSTESMTFHTRNCRLGKLIKKKYKISNNSKSYFIGKKFKPCKVCILKKKKV